MKISLSILKNLWPDLICVNCSNEDVYDYVNIVHTYEQRPNDECHLFFLTYELFPEKEGWYINKFDRRTFLPKITYDQSHWTFVLEKDADYSVNPDAKIIKVDNINSSIKILYNYVFNLVNPRVCGVTGSAGKTTTVALLEEIISLKYKCIRVYSKRITPLVLYTHIINRLDIGIEFILLEYALYRKDHIKKLVQVLPPNIAILINVRKMHIGVNGIRNQADILRSKADIITDTTIPIINVGDKFIKRLSAKTDNVITFSSRGKAMISLISKSANKVIIKCIEEKIEFKPYIFSDLTIVQAMATVAAAFLLNIDLKKTGEVISNFTPKENRMRKYRFKEWRILFDPMLTHGAYIKELSDYYIKTDKTLILYDVDFSEENSTPIIPELIKLFH